MDGIGMAVGSLLWNTVTCIIGWAVSRFGLFGSLKKVPYDNVMNIIGVVVVCIGGCFFATIKHHPMTPRPAPWQLSLMRDGNASKPEREKMIPTSTRITSTSNVNNDLHVLFIVQIVAYPILAKAPGIVCSVWAILLFKEIKIFVQSNKGSLIISFIPINAGTLRSSRPTLQIYIRKLID
ncbi:hypothetical protein TELCIR_04422 [Teladorsagia circumcincta]|uniref:Uncharacterized protein n=1 Tax=Teladorsagia circumcincta TaxID=45464 RepID=A0A2G9UTW7_TELCI|nr:hypothetical protein TELCIR_04422 [Teladorsagia circumcincta]